MLVKQWAWELYRQKRFSVVAGNSDCLQPTYQNDSDIFP